MKKLLLLLGIDRRTPTEKITDGIRKQVAEYDRNKTRRRLSHSYRQAGNGGLLRVDYRPGEKRTFH